MTTESARSLKKENTFDFLRLLAAVAVVIGHANADLSTNFAWGIFSVIDGVPMFFILSGMLIYMSAERIYDRTHQWRQFYWNRYLRIAPAIYAFAIVAPLILVAFGAVAISALFNFDIVVWLGSSFFLLPNFDPSAWSHVGTGTINGPLYTIPAEVSFYVVVPLLVLAAKKFGFWKMMTAMIIISLAGSYFYFVGNDITQTVLHHTFLQRAACFTVGIFWARYWGKIPVRWWAFGVCLAIYLALEIWGTGFIYGAFKPMLISIPLGYVLVVFGYKGPRFVARIPKYIGDLSFATYIWQYVVINLFLWFGFSHEWWQVGLIVVIDMAIAYISWNLVEKPALRLKRVSLREGTPDNPIYPDRRRLRGLRPRRAAPANVEPNGSSADRSTASKADR